MFKNGGNKCAARSRTVTICSSKNYGKVPLNVLACSRMVKINVSEPSQNSDIKFDGTFRNDNNKYLLGSII